MWRKNTLRFFPRDASYVEDIVCHASWPDVFEERFFSTENPLEGFFIISRRSTTHAFFSKIIGREGLSVWKTSLLSFIKSGVDDLAVTVGLEHRFSEYDAFLIARQQEVISEEPALWYRLDPKQRASLVASIRRLYTTLEAALLHPRATYIVVRQADLAKKKQDLEDYFSQEENKEKTLVVNVSASELQMRQGDIPAAVKRISITNRSHTTTRIGDYFLWKNQRIASIDLSNLYRVVKIGVGFLEGCSSLESIDLDVFENVTEIGSGFLNKAGVQVINISGLNQVRSIGNHFLSELPFLKKVYISGLNSLERIYLNFLSNNNVLKRVHISGCSKVEAIMTSCLSGNDSLEVVNLSGLKSTRVIGDRFLKKSSSLKLLGFPDFIFLGRIGRQFLYDTDIEEIYISGLAAVVQIEPEFLYLSWLENPELLPFHQRIAWAI